MPLLDVSPIKAA